MAVELLVTPSSAGRALSYLNAFVGGAVRLTEASFGAPLLRVGGTELRQPGAIAQALVAASPRARAAGLLGSTAGESVRVAKWLGTALRSEFVDGAIRSALFDSMEANLTLHTYVAGPRLTAADVVLFQRLHDVLVAGEAGARAQVGRWAAQLERDVEWASASPSTTAFATKVAASAPTAPALAASRALVAAVARATAPPTPAAVAVADKKGPPKQEGKKEAKEAKEGGGKKGGKKEGKKEAKKEGKKGGAAGAGAAGDRSPFSYCEFLVGRINKAWKHPEAEKLFCEEIDCGEAEPRKIASGLVGHYKDASELQGRLVLVAANLKPRGLVGFMSHGMVLCASDPDKKCVRLLEVPEGAKPGERVVAAGHEGEPAAPGPMGKKKYLEKASPDLRVSADLVASYQGIPLMTSAGPVKISDKSLAGGIIS